ncbi:MAG: protein kinase [Blastocatellia bacterium]|nr:protein kinase [Chloracidobacterium sp.]MBL8186077.1 protein kinase [Blastocatellia bacterium]HBE83168.1 serine/threonine protein kinase [Blastocatellia bacterium]HRJ89453.1 FHA domain-containing serine/threonine-protein kinase [Pyrinomonadaceae bacterium]HRK51612.1 FHA domain-containing serine/threonine-protein kinase [Pyrinomonadaceae bacterium]
MRVTLHVVAGPQTGRDFTFDQHDTFMIGRSEDAQFCLPHDRFFSRHHCLLEIAPPQCFLRDLGSTNGTFVNGLRVETAYLKHGDRIQGGETVLEVEVAADPQVPVYQGQRSSENTEPSLITIACLNCGTPAKAEASRPDAKLSYVCDECREKLKKNPQPIPNYQMMRVLGQGGMGSVMLARSVKDGRAVAIKTLLPEVAVSEQSLKRFLREIEVASSLIHPNIVSYIEHGTHNGIVYLVTEYVSGLDASKLAKKRGGKLNFKEVVKIIEQTLAALDFAHQKGFVHRDIKEQNILVDGTFPNYVAKLTDFGLSKSYKQTGMSGVTMVGDVAGTIAYMPPEQVRDFKEVRPPSDIYGIGMTAYSLLTGAHALDISPKAGISETVKAIFEKPIIPIANRVPDVPLRVSAVIETALAKQTELRWRTAGEMREALLRAASEFS